MISQKSPQKCSFLQHVERFAKPFTFCLRILSASCLLCFSVLQAQTPTNIEPLQNEVNKTNATNNETFPPSDFDSFKRSTLSIERVRSLLGSRSLEKKTQAFLFKELREEKLRQGEIKMQAPNLMRIKFLNRGVVVTDILVNEGVFYIHLVDQRTVYEQEWQASTEGEGLQVFNANFLLENYDFSFLFSSALSFVFDEDEKVAFNVAASAQELMAYRVKLEPKDVRLGLSNLELWITENGDIVRMTTSDTERRTADYFFYDLRSNLFLPKSDFEFILPANVRIVKNLVPVDLKESED